MMHTGVGRTHPLHIEYIHIGICLGFIQDVFTEAILSHPRISLQRKIGIVKALGKVIWIQNDLFAKWYVHDGEEYEGDMEEVVVEKEGYLHGIRVLDSDIESDSGEETDKRASSHEKCMKLKEVGVCPFTGVPANIAELKTGESPSYASPKAEPTSPSRIPVMKSDMGS
jgi:hypothetical protein